ncbi:MAG: hypothetical protein WAZ19_14615 [Anaerolineae bacterium]
MPFDDDAPSSASMNIPGSYNAIFNEADQFYRTGDLEQAAAICERMIGRITRLPERRRLQGTLAGDALQAASILLAEIHAQRGEWAALDALCEQAQGYSNADGRNRWLAEPGRLRIEYGEAAEGRAQLKALGTTMPDNFHAWNLLARQYMDEAQFELAENALDQLELAAKTPEQQRIVHYARFFSARATDNWQRILQTWRALLPDDKDGEIEELRELVIRLLIKHGALDQALELVETSDFDLGEITYFRGWLAWLRHDQIRARYLWRQLIENEDDDDLTHKGLAYCWLKQPAQALTLMLENSSPSSGLDIHDMLVVALAQLLEDDLEAARTILDTVKLRLSSIGRPPIIPGINWLEFDQLIQDETIKAEIRPYFKL